MNIYYLLSFFLITSVYSKTKDQHYFSANDTLPEEIHYLLQSFQEHPQIQRKKLITQERKKFLKNSLVILEQNFSLLGKDEIAFIVKSITYKTIIDKFKHLPIEDSLYSKKILPPLKPIIQNVQIFSSFLQMIIRTISLDLKLIISSRNFDRFLVKKFTKDARMTKDERIIQNKLIHLLPWYQKIITLHKTPLVLEDLALDIIHDLLNNLKNTIESYIEFSLFQKKPLKKSFTLLSYFPLKEWEFLPTLFHGKNIVDILDSVLIQKVDSTTILPSTLPQPLDTWVPADKALEKSIQDHRIDPNYRPPKILPKPLNDWKMP